MRPCKRILETHLSFNKILSAINSTILVFTFVLQQPLLLNLTAEEHQQREANSTQSQLVKLIRLMEDNLIYTVRHLRRSQLVTAAVKFSQVDKRIVGKAVAAHGNHSFKNPSDNLKMNRKIVLNS